MKFALVNGCKTEPQPKLRGVCTGCQSEMVAKCGTVKVWHWSHKSKIPCDLWWEPETQWHRDWKNKFPQEWQESIHRDEQSGEKHIADGVSRQSFVETASNRASLLPAHEIVSAVALNIRQQRELQMQAANWQITRNYGRRRRFTRL